MAIKSWLPIKPSSHFSVNNIPFGIISTSSNPIPRSAIAIGEHALDLAAFSKENGFSGLSPIQQHLDVFSQPSLNAFASLGQPLHREVRKYLQLVFEENTPYPQVLKDNQDLQKKALIPLAQVQSHLPLTIGDYTDFFAGINHAVNIGTLFRGAANALQPNYTHLPVAYHGRASSVVVSGTPLHRPWGQVLLDPKAEPKIPTFTPCKRLDIELELAAFVCKDSKLGEPIDISKASEYIFGYVLMNDWSARDVQMWEYVPLGPFNAKNFGTTISPWVVLADALEPFATQGLQNSTDLQDYLREQKKETGLDIQLEIDFTTPTATTTISRTNAKNLLWSFPQMVAHHTIGGCPLRVGDLLGSGTISGTEPKTQGSLLEQIDGGKSTLKLENGEERKFLQDGDTITIRGWSGEPGSIVGFGECSGTILPAVKR